MEGRPTPGDVGGFDITDDVTEVMLERARVSALQADAGLVLGAAVDEAEGLERCARAVVELLGLSLAEVWVVDPAGDRLRLAAAAGGPIGRRDDLPLADLGIGLIAASGRPYHTNSVLGDHRIDDAWTRREGIVAFAGVPLVVDGRPMGVLATFSRRPVSEIAADGLRPIGDALAQFIRRKRTEELLQESLGRLEVADAERRRLLSHLVKAQETERQRIAADIHDDSVQVLTAVSIRLHALRRQLGDRAGRLGLDELERLVSSSVERLRTMMFELSPPDLARHGLRAAILGRSGALFEGTGIEATLDHRLSFEPPRRIALAAHRIVAEALTNVRKHAEAGRVWVSVEDAGEGLLVRVADDGRGLPPGASEDELEWDGRLARHFGIDVMRQRAESMGGWFRIIGSGEHGGVEVEFWLPREPLDDPAT